MDKNQLLDLEKHAHLTITELRKSNPALAKPVDERLQKRAQRVAIERLVGVSGKLRKVAESTPFLLGAAADAATLRDSLLKGLRDAISKDPALAADGELQKDLAALAKVATKPAAPGATADVTVGDLLGLGEPIAFNPEFRRDLDAARLHRLSDATGLGDNTAKVLIEHAGSPAEITNDKLAALVNDKKLSDKEADSVGLATSLYHVLDERPELVAAAKTGISAVQELVKHDKAAWLKLIADSKTTPPGGITNDEYAELLTRKTARLFPTDALANRLAQVKVDDALKQNAGLAELRKLNPNAPVVGTRDFGALKTAGIAPGEMAKLQERYDSAVKLANRYTGMRLAAVLDDSALQAAEKDREVSRRTKLANDFFVDNGEVLGADLTPGSGDLEGLKFPAGASDADKAMVLANARTYQRTMAVTEDIVDAEALVAGGFPSALSIAGAPVETIVARTGLKPDLVKKYRDKATGIASGVTAHVGTVLDALKGAFNDTAVGNLSPAVVGFLNEIPGFADFFGNQDFCDCTHCRSIFGPAAYFVDLMSFVEENVTERFFASKPGHPLNLKTRRPDLWTLELTCDNTNKPIPYLVVINEILEDAVAADAGFSGNFADRMAVGRKVYKETLPDRVDSFGQPLNLAFEEVRIYLRHFERNLADVADAGAATGDALARLRLALAPRDYQLMTIANADLPFLRRVYGIELTEAGGTIQKFDAQELLKAMGVSRDELADLVASRFVTAAGTVTIRIRGGKRSANSVQNDIENIEGLTREALDRLHRFVRLWRATGWRIGELDLVLTHLGQVGLGSGIDARAVRAVAHIHRLQSRLDATIEELTALWSSLPQLPILHTSESTPSLARLTIPLLDRLFNQARFVETGGTFPQPGATFLHPALATVAPINADPNLSRLQAGTGTDDDQLHQLIVGLAATLGIDPSSADDSRKRFALTRRNLSLLYRHARLARILKVTIPELFALAGLAPQIPMNHVEGLSDLDALLELHAWWKATKWTLADLVRTVRPGSSVIVTSRATLANTTGTEFVTYTPTIDGAVKAPETVAFAANGNLATAIADWNAKAQSTVAFRADLFGVETANGDRLAIRLTTGTGPDSNLRITVDSASIFTAALPLVVAGVAIPDLPGSAMKVPDDVAKELVEQVRASNALVFADTVFAHLPPTAAVATSTAPIAGTAGGNTVTYAPVRNGRSEASETIAFAANATIDAAVADWNAKASTTSAFRSDTAGAESPSGTHLSIAIKDASGSSTRLTITADSAAIFTTAVPKSVTGAEITEAQSRAIVAANSGSMEAVDAEGRYRLKSVFDPTAAIGLPAGLDPSLAASVQETVRSYHSKSVLLSLLPGNVGVAAENLPHLVAMLGVDLNENGYFRELRGDVPAQRIAALVARLLRLAPLFAATAFDAESLEFIRTNGPLFGIADFDRIGISSVRRIDMFRTLVEESLRREDDPQKLRNVLLAFTSVARFANADLQHLAALLSCDIGLAQSVHNRLVLSTTPFEALAELRAAVAMAQHVGIGGAALALMQSVDYDELASASVAIQAAFRSAYEDEAEWEKSIEPFRDALLSRRRDGLVAYLVHSGAPQFDEVSDLYHYLLLDVEVEGCMRTSRVAAAIDSLQLYVHRCLMNLEETGPGDPNPAHVLPESIPDDEWAWRKNYRVWEANRKIFLYPENYIEPELRDDKTPLFDTLEEELLAKEVTDEAILEAYGRYLRGFDELAHLTIAGSYHEKDTAAKRDVLHLLGVTADDPPVFYYRRIDGAHYGAVSDERATHWSAWEKLNIQVPVRKVAPLIHNGQLYVFWIRYVTKAQNKVKDGESRFTGYQHRAYVEFSRRKLDGSWTTPQRLRLEESPFGPNSFPQSFQDDGVVLDPIVPKDETTIEVAWFDFTFYSDYEPLYDTRAHEVPKDDYTLKGYQWDQLYPASGNDLSLRGVNFQMWSPADLYRLRIGPQYEFASDPADFGVSWINPAIYLLVLLFSGGKFDLTALLPPRLVWSRRSGTRREIHSTGSLLPCFDTYTYASLLIDERFRQYTQPLAKTDPAGGDGLWTGPQWSEVITDYLASVVKPNKIADISEDATLDVVNGSVGDVVIQTEKDAFYLQAEVRGDGKYHLRRLNTSLSADIADLLFNRGLEALLATDTQLGLKEHPTELTVNGGKIHDATKTGEVDFNGSMGTYLREIFFHIPFLIANHLNSQGRFEDAQRWYHRIFDPTATETIQGLPAGLSAEERRRRELDRNWRYREFRGLTLDTLRAQLTNGAAIEQYKRDPFNPHAIARLRTSAYQKAIVMKYVDNLLDWGDDLFVKAFSQLNAEYLREATLKYVTAQEILGDRPARLGDCGEGRITPRNFTRIKDALESGSEFLLELESVIAVLFRTGSMATSKGKFVRVDAERGAWATDSLDVRGKASTVAANAPAVPAKPTRANVRAFVRSVPADVKEKAAHMTAADALILRKSAQRDKPVTTPDISTGFLKNRTKWVPGWGRSFVRTVSPVFCVPGNEKMLAYWDRVADRLYKLRHCQDIDGVFRLLPLFAPEIDPGLLVGGKAAGLSLDEILSASSGTLPPYRFRYLLDKAKGFTSVVQSFGAALLSALEKRDAEEMARLRNVHQKNILVLTTEVRKNELKIAEEGVEIVARRQAAAQYRRDYYSDLISAGLSGWEIAQYTSRVTSSVLKGVETAFQTAASISFLIPQVGSPFAMKYGGRDIGDSTASWAKVIGVAAGLAEVTGTIGGIQSGFERREEGWDHQKKLAEHDLKSIQRELVAAELRRAIAKRSVELHEKAIEQHDEIMDLFADKFSNLGLYTHLSRTLQQLHRDAYNNALAIARLAEQAYRFERPGDTTFFVGGEWDASRSGLLAGERLLMALHTMDKRFVETSTRQAEINQSFSLTQVDPRALIELKETGHCEFAIPEFYFDIFYPGQYRRRIRAVRLTIPCITGPYTNISAKLTLLGSHVRKEAALGEAHLFEVPITRTSSIATSTGQGDAGVFELSFRDEKYMPFEGAGVVSEWRLALPSHFRPFDYQSINDVILNISYTAEEDGAMRQQVESQNAAVEGALLHYLANNTLTRVFSLRQEFSNAFNRLIEAPAGTPVTIDITDRHFPLFLQGRALTAPKATMVLAVGNRGSIGNVSLSVNATVITELPDPTDPPAPGEPFGGLPSKPMTAAFAAGLKKQHTITVNDAGDLAEAPGTGSFAPDKLRDILLVVEYQA